MDRTETRRATSTLIDHIVRVDLRVQDIARSLRFYRDVVGLEVVESSPESASLRAPGGSELLRLRSAGVRAPAEHNATGLFHVAIRFPTRAALGDVLARLVDSGVEIGAGDHGVSEALYVDDPDGNGVELYRDRPIDEWPAPAGDELVGMTTGPVDMHGVLDSGTGPEAVGASAVAGTDIGHVHLRAADIETTVRFYAEELGLDLMQRFGGQAAFLSSNGYHHHIGANTWHSRNGARARPDRAGLDRIVFAVPDREQLERVRLRLGGYGRDVRGEEGRSLEVLDPNGVELQFVLG